jgi:hypothetical protein
MDVWTDGRTEGWVDGWMGGWVDGPIPRDSNVYIKSLKIDGSF